MNTLSFVKCRFCRGQIEFTGVIEGFTRETRCLECNVSKKQSKSEPEVFIIRKRA